MTLYLLVWLGCLGLGIFFDDWIMEGVVTTSAGWPRWLAAAAGWAPYGLTMLLLGIGNLTRADNPVSGNLGRLIALCGLAMAVQTPVAFNRHSSDDYELLAATPTGGAFVAGAFWAWAPLLGVFTLFLTVRWIHARIKGSKRPFKDDSWARSASNLRVMGATMTLLVLGSLLAAVLTA